MKKFKDLKMGDIVYYLDKTTDGIPKIEKGPIMAIAIGNDVCHICVGGDKNTACREFKTLKNVSYMGYMYSSVSTSRDELKDDLIRELSYRKERHDKMSEKYRLALEKAKMNI